MRTQSLIATGGAVGLPIIAVVFFRSLIDVSLDIQRSLVVVAIVVPIFALGGGVIGWLIGGWFDADCRAERAGIRRAERLQRASRGPLNGWARLGVLFVIVGACLFLAAAVWAIGLMNHGGRSYGWLLVAALAFATDTLFKSIQKDRSNYSFGSLAAGLFTCYLITAVGIALASGYAEDDFMTGVWVGGFLLAPAVVVGLIGWVMGGFRQRPAE